MATQATSEDFEVRDLQLAVWAKALSHPARIAILRTLAATNACICGQIVDALPLAQSTVSQHLKVLREAGLVRGESDGPRSCYFLDTETLRRVRAEVTQLADSLVGAPIEATDGTAHLAQGCGC